jgi:Fe-S cluster biogenesis protein NfuA
VNAPTLPASPLNAPAAPGAELTCTAPAADLNQQANRLQAIIEKAEALPNPAARVLVQECLESVLAFYGEGLSRILELVTAAEAEGKPALDSLVQDPAVSGLLLIHGLHPLDLETRVRGALEKVRPYMESHGGNVELLGLEDGHARLRLQGTCKTCSASTVTLELAVRSALQEACPDLAGFEVEQ